MRGLIPEGNYKVSTSWSEGEHITVPFSHRFVVDDEFSPTMEVLKNRKCRDTIAWLNAAANNNDLIAAKMLEMAKNCSEGIWNVRVLDGCSITRARKEFKLC